MSSISEPQNNVGESMRTLVILSSLVLVGCTDQVRRNKDVHEATNCARFPGLGKKPINLDFKVRLSGESRPLIELTTNLPEGTEIGSMLKSPGYPPSYIAQTDGHVKCGKVTLGPYSKQGDPLPSGKYEVSVTAPLVIVQPKAVQKYLGVDYEHFKSPLITSRSSNEDIDGSVISYADEIVITPPS
jgi:hypothetical protein